MEMSPNRFRRVAEARLIWSPIEARSSEHVDFRRICSLSLPLLTVRKSQPPNEERNKDNITIRIAQAFAYGLCGRKRRFSVFGGILVRWKWLS